MAGFIPEKKYKEITKSAPIATNDILLGYKNKYFLAKRNNEPAKGLWWTLGGRIQKNERITDSVRRVCKEELGIAKIRIKKFLGVSEAFCRPGKFGQKDMHNITFCFLVEPAGDFGIKIDSQHSEYKFFAKAPKNSHPFIKKIFYLANKKDFNPSALYTFKIQSA